MGNSIAWPIIRLVQRLSMFVTLGCCIFVVFYLFSRNQDNFMPADSNAIQSKNIDLLAPATAFDLKAYNTSADPQTRDIFSIDTTVSPSGAVENTPKGQLPDHLKVVAILIAHPSQIAVQDTLSNTTYFIDEYHPQDGIKIVKVDHDQMTINYQGQNIFIPVKKD